MCKDTILRKLNTLCLKPKENRVNTNFLFWDNAYSISKDEEVYALA